MSDSLKLLALVAALMVAGGCGPSVDHPTPKEALEAEGEVVGTVNTRTITVREVQLLSERTGITDPRKLRDELIERELLVDEALEKGATPGIQHARKRAMVRQLLADEVEARVSADTVDEAFLAQVLPRMEAELRGPHGEKAIALYIGPRSRSRKESEALADEAKAKAEEVYEQLAENPSPESILQFDVSSVKHPLGASVNRSMIIVDPSAPRDTRPDGWLTNPDLYQKLRTMEVGEMSDLVPLGFGYGVLLKREPIEPDGDVSDEEVERQARLKARDALRSTYLERLIKKLRADADVDTYPRIIEQQQKQDP